jgi:HPt (histidine-containing phosphotransfer) domain-containing protein
MMSATEQNDFQEQVDQIPLLKRETFEMVENEIAAGIPDIMLDLLETFLTDSESTLNSIVEGLGSANHSALERNAHSLKSTFATFGADRGAAYFGRMEQLAREGHFAQVSALLPSVQQVYGQTRQIFEQERERVAANL